MKKITLITTLTIAMLTTASADFSFMGDMIRDMTNVAKNMKDEAIDMKDTISDNNTSDDNSST